MSDRIHGQTVSMGCELSFLHVGLTLRQGPPPHLVAPKSFRLSPSWLQFQHEREAEGKGEGEEKEKRGEKDRE